MRVNPNIPAKLIIKLLLIVASHYIVGGNMPVHAQSIGYENPLDKVSTGICKTDENFVIAVHGGAVFSRSNNDSKVEALKSVLNSARDPLSSGARAIDVVEAVIAQMENSGAFNAGKGSIVNQTGVVEMDASIMDGRNHEAGAVASVEIVRNPISAARLVMDESRHVMLVGSDADNFVKQKNGAVINTTYFLYGGQNFDDVPLPQDIEIVTPGNHIPAIKSKFSGKWAGVWPEISLNHVLVVEQIKMNGVSVVYALGAFSEFPNGEGMYQRLPASFVEGNLRVIEPPEMGGFILTYRMNPDGSLTVFGSKEDDPVVYETTLQRLPGPGEDHDGGTVGAVVRDRCGDLAAGTSTGGFDAKMPGRVGDSPIIGAGTYADNETAAISATGHGELFIRYVVAHEITMLMKYKELSLEDAATNLIKDELVQKGVRGGVIAVDRDGNVAMPFNTEGMVRGTTSNKLAPKVEVY